jgi:hypothetical protein
MPRFIDTNFRTKSGPVANNDDAVLREVDQALAEERQFEGLRRQMPVFIGAAALIVAGVAGWQAWRSNLEKKATENAVAYREAAVAPLADDSRETFKALADDGAPGYVALARLRIAGNHVAAGERAEALSLYRSIYSDSGATRRLKDLARIRAAYLSIDDGRDAAMKDLGALVSDGSALGAYAKEISGVAAIKAGDFQTAEQIFRDLAASTTAPEPVRERAGEFAALAGAGKSGAPLDALAAAAKPPADSIVDALKEQSRDLGAALDRASGAPVPEAPQQSE